MNARGEFRSVVLPQVGCLIVLALLASMCLLPYLVAVTFDSALDRLHLSRGMTLLALAAIFLGSLVNVPLYRIERSEAQFEQRTLVYSLWGLVPPWPRQATQTLVAVNLGGCVAPLLIAGNELPHVLAAGPQPAWALLLACAANIIACYRGAMLLPGVGIAMPALLAPLVAVGATWLLLGSEYASVRASVAFIAGVMGPLVGADLLNLPRISRVSAAVVSIGGAGTFDGIVLSAILAALLA